MRILARREKVGYGDAIGFLNESQLALSFLGSVIANLSLPRLELT